MSDDDLARRLIGRGLLRLGSERRDEPRPDVPALDRYEVLGKIGSGAFGEVFRARDRQMDRVVALKRIRGARVSKERVDRERQALVALRHELIPQVWDAVLSGDELTLVMELVEGTPLDEVRGLALHEKVALVADVARTIDFAHAAGFVHRDLKPRNVIVGRDGRPRVVDFGAVKVLGDDGLTRTGVVIGSPSYMAPEQAAGESKRTGPATDVFALGVILYELLTGTLPFTGENFAAITRAIVEDDPTPPRALDPTIPRALERVVLTALAKKDRYPSARAFADALAPFARPVARGRASDFVLVILACAVVGALVGLAAARSSREDARDDAPPAPTFAAERPIAPAPPVAPPRDPLDEIERTLAAWERTRPTTGRALDVAVLDSALAQLARIDSARARLLAARAHDLADRRALAHESLVAALALATDPACVRARALVEWDRLVVDRATREPTDAIAAIRSALSSPPEERSAAAFDPDLERVRGDALLLDGEVDSALAQYESVLARSPRSTRALAGKALALEARAAARAERRPALVEDARAVALDALELSPGCPEAALALARASGIPLLRRAIGPVEPATDASVVEDALARIERAIAANPREPLLVQLRANAAAELARITRDPDRVAPLRDALRAADALPIEWLGPWPLLERAEAHLVLAELAHDRAESDVALRLARGHTDRFAADPTGWSVLAMLLDARGDHDEAEQARRHVQPREPRRGAPR